MTPAPGSSGRATRGIFCNIPRTVDPGVVACSIIARLFDIRDPEHPKEIAYYVTPPGPFFGQPLEFERGEVWYSDAHTGFHAVRVTNGVWPLRDEPASAAALAAARTVAGEGTDGPITPATGTSPVPAAVGGLLVVVALGLRRMIRRPV